MNTNTTIHRVSILCLAALALALSGCLSIETPEEFLLLEESSDELKLITPDEAKLWVREFADDDRGDLDFWVAALQADFVDNRGYTLLEDGALQDAAGRDGHEWLFEATTHGETYRYLVTLQVREDLTTNTIRVSEYVATKEKFDAYLGSVREAVASVRP